MPRALWAHSVSKACGKPHLLEDHLIEVGRLAASFASSFGGEDCGQIVGVSHDIGKADSLVQRRIRGEAIRAEHAIHGAKLWIGRDRKNLAAQVVALVIAAHHTGLPNLSFCEPEDRPSRALKERLNCKVDLDEILAVLPPDLLPQTLPTLPDRFLISPIGKSDKPKFARGLELFTRFVFSALVDADYLDTEAHFQGNERADLKRGYEDIATLRGRLGAHLAQLVGGLDAEVRCSIVNQTRSEVLSACRARAKDPPGFFSLTVPTGGGKTLSSLAFALAHAEEHGLRRVISAIPYTSILEQNATAYAQALGRDQVVEHHSALDYDDESARDDWGDPGVRRLHELSTENWDAPVVVTTNVQLFESLFANRTSSCRKLHNVARSVLLLDEAQNLPLHLLEPILDGLRELVDHYGCSVVFTTATRPTFDASDGLTCGLEGVREIVPDPSELARRLRRIEPEWRHGESVEWPALAEELATLDRVLCIVHTRRDARELADALTAACGDEAESVFHLSAGMCPAHRSEVLDAIKLRLEDSTSPCRLIATQVVEAGVDIDFPVVYRALGGLDSLVQAAGRCNREGRLDGPGRFVVFRAPSLPPPGVPAQGLGVMETLLQEEHAVDLADPEVMARFFRTLYRSAGSTGLDSEGIQAYRAKLAFATVARKFRMIDDAWAEGVVVRWGQGIERVDAIRDAAAEPFAQDKDLRKLRRQLQPFTVNVPRQVVEAWLKDGVLEVIADSVLVLSEPYLDLYSNRFGLTVSPDVKADPMALVL